MRPHALNHLHDPGGADDPAAADPARAAAPPSVLRALNAVQCRLEGFQNAPDGGNAGALRATARELLHALDLSADVALACVLRNQVAGSYAMRHSIETAVVAALVARRLRMRPVHLLSLVSAALALHATGRHAMDENRRDVPHIPHIPHIAHSAQALHCTRAAEPDTFACLLFEHTPPERAGDDLSATAHLLRMADRYCAGISPRDYRRALLPDDALARTLALAPDPELAAAFRDEIGHYPPGAVVRLAGGEIGVVTYRDGAHPEVTCLVDDGGRVLAVALPRRVGENGCAIAAALGEEDTDLRIPMRQVWGTLAAL